MGRRVDYLIVDEAGFLNPEHVDQLAELVDEYHVDVYCFGLATDFRSLLLPGAKRLMELADEISEIQVEVLCWCGLPGRHNARVIGGRITREGDTVLVADTVAADGPTRSATRCCAGRTTAAATSARRNWASSSTWTDRPPRPSPRA